MSNKLAARSEQGMALMLVLLIVTCILLLSLGFFYVVKGQERQTSLFVDRNSGGYYAEAGVNQYIWDLNQPANENYYVSHPTVAGEYENGYYSMTVTPPSAADPTVTVDSTGWTARDPQNPTTIEYKLKKRQFTDYVFCSQQEVTPPMGASQSEYENYWGTGDEVHNAIHTNGKFYFNGSPRFDDTATFSGVATYIDNGFINGGYDSPQFYNNGVLSSWQNQCYYAGELQWPNSNSELKTLAQYSGGLYFPGRTSLYLHDDSETPPRTVIDAYYWDPAATTGPQWIYKTNLPLPANGVIYVDGTTEYADVTSANQNPAMWDLGTDGNQNISQVLAWLNPADNGTNNPQHPLISVDVDKFNPARGNVFVSGVLRGQLTIASANDIYICPTDPTHSFVPYPTGWPAKPGIVYGGTTFNNDGTVANLGSNDMLGLIATNYVRIIHNFWPSTRFDNFTDSLKTYETTYDCDLQATNVEPNASAAGGIYIDGAIFALNVAFEFEDYWMDSPKGHINLIGSMIQRFRGAEGINSPATQGYNDNYWHDARMDYQTPPHFLSPLNAGWGVVSWRQLPSGQSLFVPVTGIVVGGYDGASSCNTLQSLQMVGIIFPANATNQNLLWSIADSGGAQATIDEDSGLLLAGATSGLAVVTATAEDGSGVTTSYNIAIGTFTPVSSIVVSDINGGTTHTAQVNSTLQMEYTIHPGSGVSPYTNYSGTGDPQPWATTPGVTWKLYDPDGTGSTIDSNGILTAGNVTGTVTVMATAIDGSQVTGTENVAITPAS
jgi:hypothetical protein